MNAQTPKHSSADRSSNFADGNKWPTLVVMAALLIATIAEWYWVWGLLFLYWTLTAFVTGQAFVIQTIRQDEHPFIFWFVGITWVVLAVLVVLYDFFPDAALWMESANE